MIFFCRFRRLQESGLYNQWKHEMRYALGVEGDKHPQRAETAAEVTLTLKEMGIFFKYHAILTGASIVFVLLEILVHIIHRHQVVHRSQRFALEADPFGIRRGKTVLANEMALHEIRMKNRYISNRRARHLKPKESIEVIDVNDLE